MTSGSKSKKMLSQDEMEEAIEEMTDKAKAQGIGAAVVGGYAMRHYGSDRLTTDVDFVADGRLRGFRAQETLSFGGVKIIAPNEVPVDWIVRDDAYQALYEEALEKARSVGRRFRVVSAEYLAAMKMAAARPKDELDFQFLLQAGVVDLKKARKLIARLMGAFAGDEFDRAADEAEWKKQREEGRKPRSK